MTFPKDPKIGQKVISMRRGGARSRSAAGAPGSSESVKVAPTVMAEPEPAMGAAEESLSTSWWSILEPYTIAAFGAAIAFGDLQLALLCRNQKLLEQRFECGGDELRELQGLTAALMRAEDPLDAARVQLELIRMLLSSGFAQGAASLDDLQACLANAPPSPATKSVSNLAAHRLSPGSALKH
ncbi:hypothetical protein SAMN07250955_12012 [Arboricoccus pini]|uniref:Uncharacterized protein n=1 Tax=Arboricoccus pini TaxID=1963835 RepID=A0A212S262_9PROT|nr:hypothetical protein [Arboricoccus pini]SNB79060.1 hypothetical protein SAMN07250955_12012 [Arboricoccus pini]